LDLYVSVDSKHSYEKIGCTSCHDGSGQETDFVLTAHTARDIWVDQKTGAAVLPEQVINPPEEHHAPTLASMLESVYPHDALVPLGASSLHMPFASHAEAHRGTGDSPVSSGQTTGGSPVPRTADVQLASAEEGAG